MTTYISILRGINVSGNRIIKMEALRQVYNELGFEQVQSYIQSGNVVFKQKNIDSKKLETIITKAIKDNFLFDVPVLVIPIHEFKTIIENNPYISDPAKNSSFLHITFLDKCPDPKAFDLIKDMNYYPDEYFIKEKAIYLYCPNGYSNSKLTNSFIEKKLNVSATTRNWKTTNELYKIASSI